MMEIQCRWTAIFHTSPIDIPLNCGNRLPTVCSILCVRAHSEWRARMLIEDLERGPPTTLQIPLPDHDYMLLTTAAAQA
jgi:hypothetical protein